MSTCYAPWWIHLIVIGVFTLVGIGIGFGWGLEAMQEKMEKDAIDKGKAQYKVDPKTGEVEFEYL